MTLILPSFFPENTIVCYDNTYKKFIINEVIKHLPSTMKVTLRKFRKYQNKFNYFRNKSEKVEYQLWKIDAKELVDQIFYQDLSKLIMDYL